MADEPINLALASTSQVASRFVSSSDLESARLKREEEWKATYARLGQEAPPMPKEEYDCRSLYEKLKETKDKKQEAFEEQLKFKNQFRALDDEEVAFLDDAAEERRAAELAKEREIQKEMEHFKKAVAARIGEPPPIVSSLLPATAKIDDNKLPGPSVSPPVSMTMLPPKKTRKAKDFQRSFLAGAIRPKATAEGALSTKKRKSSTTSATSGTSKEGLDRSLSPTSGFRPPADLPSDHAIQSKKAKTTRQSPT